MVQFLVMPQCKDLFPASFGLEEGKPPQQPTLHDWYVTCVDGQDFSSYAFLVSNAYTYGGYLCFLDTIDQNLIANIAVGIQKTLSRAEIANSFIRKQVLPANFADHLEDTIHVCSVEPTRAVSQDMQMLTEHIQELMQEPSFRGRVRERLRKSGIPAWFPIEESRFFMERDRWEKLRQSSNNFYFSTSPYLRRACVECAPGSLNFNNFTIQVGMHGVKEGFRSKSRGISSVNYEITIRDDSSFAQLHERILDVMGWDTDYLHGFNIPQRNADTIWAVNAKVLPDELTFHDTDLRISDCLSAKSMFTYHPDYPEVTDEWTVSLQVVKVERVAPNLTDAMDQLY